MERGIGISTLERNGRIVAHSEGAAFTAPDMYLLANPRHCYVVTFLGHEDYDDETATIYAIDDATALEWAAAKFIPPYQLTEKITTWRDVAEIN